MTQEQLIARLDAIDAEMDSLRATVTALCRERSLTAEQIRAAFAQTDDAPSRPPQNDPAYIYDGQDDAALRTRQLAASEKWAQNRQRLTSDAEPTLGNNDAKHA